jgi:hypothetical protein
VLYPGEPFLRPREMLQMRSISGETVIATLDRRDFERARSAIEGFECWATFEDYQCDREGRRIGLESAGRWARFAPISIGHFLSWSGWMGVAPTAARLDEFAELVDEFRRNPRFPRDARLSCDYSSRNPVSDGRLVVPVDPRSYREWLDCLGNRPSDSLLNAYASFLLEMWAEGAPTSAFSDETFIG